MEVVSVPGGDAPNEDWCGVTADAVVVLDGVSVLPGIVSGCVHETPWYVRQLGIRLLSAMTRDPSRPLAAVLGAAIAEVTALHADTCDLSTIGAPSATVAAVRSAGPELEYLVLADVTVVLETASGLDVMTDSRVAASVAGLDARSPRLGERLGEARRAHRNRPGGYWVAADDPVAADHAITGSVPLETVRGVMVLSDGAARLVDLFGRDWAHAVAAGPAEIIRQVRALEDEDPGCVRWPRTKHRDDATAARWTLPLGTGTC
jgi:hypothetical protein